MPVANCSRCKVAKANVKRSKTADCLCKECFFYCFEREIHETIINGRLFKRGDTVAIGASGGKDSTVLAYILKLLNDRHDYGLRLVLLSIDEGITGYRDDSLETVKQNGVDYALPLTILSYEELYGWTMDEIVRATGVKNNCTFCGVFRRQALERGAARLRCDRIATGHNADDIAETILMNVLRGDIARLGRSTKIVTSAETDDNGDDNGDDNRWGIPRCKPFKYTYEKEIVLYARFKRLLYFSTECIYSPNAYRGHVRVFLKELEKIRPSAILDIIHSGESIEAIGSAADRLPQKGVCARCAFISSQRVCKACVMLEGLNSGRPKLGISKSSRIEGIKRGGGDHNDVQDEQDQQIHHRKAMDETNRLRVSCAGSDTCCKSDSRSALCKSLDKLTLKSDFE